MAFYADARITSRRNLVLHLHATVNVVKHMAVQEPGPRIIGPHVSRHHRAREQIEHIRSASVIEQGLAMPVWRVQVALAPHPQGVPADPGTVTHDEALQVTEDAAVDRMHQAALFPVGFIENEPRRDEFLVHIVRCRVRARPIRGCHDDRAQQSSIGLVGFFIVRVIPPNNGTRVF